MKSKLIKSMIFALALMVNLPVFAGSHSLPKHFLQQSDKERIRNMIIKDVRYQLVTLPYYDVFDWLEFEVKNDDSVILRGQVVRPTTKSAAEKRLRNLESVSNVINEIEVLPVSPSDDRLRLRLYRSLFGQNSPLFRYSIQAVPPIHIIVKNGRVTLKGVVASEGDKRIAYSKVTGISGTFEVKNELIVEK
jgi:hyperosmotically inducible protein